jgi:RHS repeat-associated protein
MVVNKAGTVKQITHYYPYGGIIGGIDKSPSYQQYKFEGKELDRTYGLDWYDIHARQYDPVVPSWHTVDPMAEKYYGISPYAYCANNPVNTIDPGGDTIVIINETKNVLSWINSLAQGVYDVNQNGELYLKESKVTNGYSSYYSKRLNDAIQSDKKISISVNDYYIDQNGKKRSLSSMGEGLTINRKDGNQLVVLSGKEHKLFNNNKKQIKDTPNLILAHELVGHAIPHLSEDLINDTGNAKANENIVRTQTGNELRDEEPFELE